MMPLTHEREITSPVDLCDDRGRLNPDAVGWSRRPLHRCNLAGRFGRKKRWDYYAVTSDAHFFAVTYADVDYLGLATVWLFERATGRSVEHAALSPLGRGFHQGETVGGADLEWSGQGLWLRITEEPAGTRIETAFRTRGGDHLTADLRLALPPGHETLSVVIPWSRDTFQYTSKHNTRPAKGEVVLNGAPLRFGPENQGFGCLDYGRGIWPYRTTWNWASASGLQEGRVVGLQLGGKWTDGTGMTENALCVDGRLRKIGETLRFEYDRRDFRRPWRIETPDPADLSLTFTPEHLRELRLPLGLLHAELHHGLGRFSGHLHDEAGRRVRVHDLFGWAEEVRARW